MTETEKAASRHTLWGTIFAGAVTAYVVAAFYFNFSAVEVDARFERMGITVSAFALMLFFGKLHDHALQAELPWWITKILQGVAFFAAFVLLYPFIKFGMFKVFGL